MKLRCYVAIKLKACDFEPGFVSQLNMYQNVVNDVLRHPDDKPTIGLLLVKGKNSLCRRNCRAVYLPSWAVPLARNNSIDLPYAIGPLLFGKNQEADIE